MKHLFFKKRVIKSILSPYRQYCVGYPGQGNYLSALVMGIGAFKNTFSHSGSDILDKIVAYDKAEVSGAYTGQINMSLVSSFIGSQGLIWGYDIVKQEDIKLPSFLSLQKLSEFQGIEIKNGENLRKASKALFGTNKEKHFPFLPGTHVPCAGRFYHESGPVILYGVVAIGIPRNREKAACLLMEDVGKIVTLGGNIELIKEKIILDTIRSVIKIGRNHGVEYQEIFIDFISEKISPDEMGCVLIAMPYFLLAKKAFNMRLISQSLEEWIKNTQKGFLHHNQ